MPAILAEHSYGKSRIRLTKVTRLADRHEVRELRSRSSSKGISPARTPAATTA